MTFTSHSHMRVHITNLKTNETLCFGGLLWTVRYGPYTEIFWSPAYQKTSYMILMPIDTFTVPPVFLLALGRSLA